MGALKNAWNSPHLDIWSKYFLFWAIPMNLLLWGCKTWSMQKALSNKLEVFLHCNNWCILRLSMFHVKEKRLHNKHVRKMFYDIPRVGNMIAARQLGFLDKMIHGPHDRPAQQMLTAYCDNVRRVGCPFLHNKDYIVKSLCLLFANVPEVTIDDYDSLKHWIREALDEKYWNNLIACLLDRQASIPPRPNKWPRPSPRNHDAPLPNQHPFPPTHPRTQCLQRPNPPTTPDPSAWQGDPEFSPSPPRPLPPRQQQPAPPPTPQADRG
jgi:hypothetical protein